MSDFINFDQYLQRIGFTGSPKVDLPTLSAIQRLHVETIPFESLNPFTSIPVSLELTAIEKKMVKQQRGGYCFEQNKLFKAVLQQIGFQVKGLAARVIFDKSTDAISPFSHMLLLIDLDGKQYLADVGFGGLSPTSPLELRPNIKQATKHETYRLSSYGNYFHLEAMIKEAWKALYKFHLEEHFDQDYEVMNWYTSCHPSSHFTNTLIAARAFPGGRYTLRNTSFTIHSLDQPSEQRALGSPEEILEILKTTFKLNLSDLPTLTERIKQLF